MKSKRDRLFCDASGHVGPFRFDARVAEVFEDMITRSVPGYRTVIDAIGILAAELAQPHSRCYDLGCSLGAAALAMAQTIQVPDCEIIAVDNAWPMISRFRDHLRGRAAGIPVRLVCADLADIHITDASLVVMNFTLQFVPLAGRARLLEKVHRGLKPGGALLLSEKIALPDPRQQALFSKMHHAFKRDQGYSELEISRKRTALENVLIPEALPAHLERLAAAGFSSAEVWFQYFNFVSLIAIK